MFSFFCTASSLTCYKCQGSGNAPNCTEIETCGSTETQCLSEVEKDDDDKLTYQRGCTVPGSCTANEGVCSFQKLAKNIKECAYKCCKSDKCNNEWPSFDSGIQVTSGLVAISLAAFFALFVM